MSTCRYCQDPYQEGERVLHDLDTLPAQDVADWLLSLALAASYQLLADTRAAANLPPATQLLDRFHA